MTSYAPRETIPAPGFASDRDLILELAKKRKFPPPTPMEPGLLFPPVEPDREAPGWRGRRPQGEVFEGHPRTPQGPIGPGDSRDPWPTEQEWAEGTRRFIDALERFKNR